MENINKLYSKSLPKSRDKSSVGKPLELSNDEQKKEQKTPNKKGTAKANIDITVDD